MLNKKKNILFMTSLFAALIIGISGCAKKNEYIQSEKSYSPMVGDKNEEYYMITFQSGMEYWKSAYRGFEDAGKLYGIKTVYTGSIQYDINQEVTILEQIIAKKPAGIAISCINPDALAAPINKAVDLGIPVVTFDADSPKSKRYSTLATDNEYAGYVAAKTLSEQIGEDGGEVVIITLPMQQNHEQRAAGFKEALEKEYKNLKLIEIGNGKSDPTEAAKVLSVFFQLHPNIKGVFCTDATSGVGAATAVKEANKAGQVKIVSFDTEKGTLDAIKSGIISASIAQETYVMGYQSMNFLYQLKHNLINPSKDWKNKKINPLPRFVDTGVSVVTKENVDSFYEK
ncbi:monosaccharide ABC transporter substrate-binding protein, CUT2 family [Clostridium sp. USBA 49]|uniref:substrate-binding domain-containing protein n=1 Tax=Clostridium sp. USBA 49 TaxID=1881060 RepID=UPI00099A3435|nr:substrate-binding domain-containing protein [Clostridium sp. USBA 49]SKA83146.1 monosaccharide ABC transporter substrate-binding protein, CUT2 family [Clostridium sp. USBA 49]